VEPPADTGTVLEADTAREIPMHRRPAAADSGPGALVVTLAAARRVDRTTNTNLHQAGLRLDCLGGQYKHKARASEPGCSAIRLLAIHEGAREKQLRPFAP